jgi:hypothetical protein
LPEGEIGREGESVIALQDLAEQVRARDLFVLHRVGPNELVNLDGHGRGAGWAGIVSVDPAAEPLLAGAQRQRLVRHRRAVPARLFGPYWASEAVAVTVENDVVVIGGPGVAEGDDDALRAVARDAAALVAEVPVAKRLADELEVTKAALSVSTLRRPSLDDTAVAVAATAAGALSCEFGAVMVTEPAARVLLAPDGWRPPASEDEILAALLPLQAAIGADVLVEQDLGATAFPYRPLTLEDGLVSRAAVRLGDRRFAGLLDVAHAAEAPRGFTSLCCRVLAALGGAAAQVLADHVGHLASA